MARYDVLLGTPTASAHCFSSASRRLRIAG